jgi:hypothetical protein
MTLSLGPAVVEREFPRQPVSPVPRPQDHPATIFASGHGFTKTGSSTGTLADDTTVFSLGSQSIKITPSTDGTATNVRKLSISPVVDFTGRMLKVVLRTDNVAGIAGCKLYVSSDNLSAAFGFVELLQGSATFRPIQNDEWVLFTVPWNALSLTGSPTRTAINALQVQVTATAGQVVNVWCNLIGSQQEPANGVVSVCFDDGWVTEFTAARPKLDQYGLRPTMYVIAETLGSNASYMTVAQAQELQQLHGWEIGAHAFSLANHDAMFTTLTQPALEAEFAALKTYMWRLGFRGVDHLAYPLGAYDLTTVLPAARKFFLSARTVALYQQESWPPYDPHRLRVLATSNATSAATVTAAIDKAIADKTWLILLFHKIPVTETGTLDFSVAKFATVVDYLATTGVRVKPVGEIIHGGVV